ncbi:MAG: 30S ribosomal protein S6 [Rickettsiales bacterium]|nr:30S ribosomal protein S6 [Rickettsiales bacterium]
MALYETIIIARGDLATDDVDALADKFAKVVTDNKGTLVSKEYWGLRKLAYDVKKNSRGHYILLNIDSEYEAVAELKRVISFNEDVIRSLTFKVEAHNKEGLLFASKTAKDFKAGKISKKKEPSKTDLVLEKVQFEV